MKICLFTPVFVLDTKKPWLVFEMVMLTFAES